MVFLRDVTARVRAEAVLRESEGLARQPFTRPPLPKWVYDAETLAFLDVNEAAVCHYGYTRDEFLALTIRDIRPPEDIPRMLAVARAPHPAGGSQGVFRHRTRAAEIIEVEVFLRDLRHEGLRAVIAVVQDVTERRRAEAALLEASRAATVGAFGAGRTRERSRGGRHARGGGPDGQGGAGERRTVRGAPRPQRAHVASVHGPLRFDAPMLRSVALFDRERPDVRVGGDTPMREAYCAIVDETERPFATPDTQADPILAAHPARDVVVSCCGTLVRDAQGRAAGTLCHFDGAPRSVLLTEMPVLEAVAPLLASVLSDGTEGSSRGADLR